MPALRSNISLRELQPDEKYEFSEPTKIQSLVKNYSQFPDLYMARKIDNCGGVVSTTNNGGFTSIRTKSIRKGGKAKPLKKQKSELVDFESWKTILERSENNSSTINSQGAVCVLPNSLEARNLDTKGNIYAFGVLLLDIISGRPPYCKEKGHLVDWAKDYLEKPEVMSHLVDPELKNFRHEELKVICDVVTLCINHDPTVRPSMRELCNMLESKIDTTESVDLKSSSFAWAELHLLS